MTNRTKISIIFAVLVVAALTYGYLDQGKETTGGMEPKGKAAAAQDRQYPDAPEFTLSDLDGDQVSLSDYRGKVVVIDFWATWCPPCRKGIPDFVELQKAYGEDKLVILGVNLDQGAPAQVMNMVRDFTDNYNINYPVLLHDMAIVGAYGGIQSIPTTFVVDQEGKVRQGVVGYRPKDYFKSIIDSLL